MKKIHLLLILFLIIGCNSSKNRSDSSVFYKKKAAQWITDESVLPTKDSLFYLNHPAPVFRKEFKTKNIQNAKLYITAAGYYTSTINGIPIKENVLDPAWTDFSKRIYYSEYDITSYLYEGENCIGVVLGNGFYNPLPLRKWGRRNLRNDLTVGKPIFIAKLIITHKSGKTEEIVSDESWKYSYGPIMKNSVYLGVVYDARNITKGWKMPGFNDDSWLPVKVGKSPGGELQKTFFPPVQVTKEITPIKITRPENGIFLVDMGVNFTGTYKIKLSGSKGDTITFRFGERIYEDGTLNPMTSVIGQIKRKGIGGPGAPEIAWQTDSYVVGDNDEHWFRPEFTYHTFRYMEIKGLDKKPELSSIKGLFFHSNVEKNGTFSCSSDLLNTIQEATDRTFRANLVSVQSDCPSREKFGYGGDLNATSESFIYNYDMQSFYRKTIYDWLDAMNDTSFVDTAPFTGIMYCGISWESAYLITQYYLYLYYNDVGIIKELYETNKKWMDKVAGIHPDGLVEQGLSDHESLEPVPVQLTGTCHYLQCARIMKTFASVMEDAVSVEKYRKLEEKLANLVKTAFWDKPVKAKINRQTLFSTLLFHEIIPANEIQAAKDSLLNALENGPSGHFSTGIFGTKYILETLSEHVSPEVVFEVVHSKEYPGWGHMIDCGATTIWETWKESENTYSNCHPMFGTVTEWYYRWLGGIRPDTDNPGFKKFILAPSTPDGLDSVYCSYTSPFGKIVSSWKKENSVCRYKLKIPSGSSAKVVLPVNNNQIIKAQKKHHKIQPHEIDGLSTGIFNLKEGEYVITVSSDAEINKIDL